jgi:hypothetical protein
MAPVALGNLSIQAIAIGANRSALEPAP